MFSRCIRGRANVLRISALAAIDCICYEPMPYIEFLSLQNRAAVVITDSGGIQEETTYLGVPCLTLRANTERPITVTLGTNILVGNDMIQLRSEVSNILAGNAKKGAIPPLWDGQTGYRIAQIVAQL